jgi:hypothetical protein
MDLSTYQAYLDQLQMRLLADPAVLGLITLGSTADATYRDKWSDHDFWIITQPGAQARYLNDLGWLPDTDQIFLSVRYGQAYRTILYRNQHKIEYAIFDRQEATAGLIQQWHVLIDRDNIVALAQSIQAQTQSKQATDEAWPDRLEHFCILLWSVYERSARGELLSAQQYLYQATSSLLDLLTTHVPKREAGLEDQLEPRRRMELRYPELAQELQVILSHPPVQASVALLEFAQHILQPLAPQLAWDKVEIVKQWLQQD